MKDPDDLLVDHDVDVIADERMRHAVADGVEIEQSIPQATKPLVQPLLSTIRLARERAEELRECREALRVAVGMLAHQNDRIDYLEAANLGLRAQLRAAMSGRAVAEERQDFEREQLDAANGHDECSERHDSRRAA